MKSELAFKLNGEPFEVPGNAVGWRARTPDHVLDLAITRLKAALPPGTEAASVHCLNVPLVAVGGVPGGRT